MKTIEANFFIFMLLIIIIHFINSIYNLGTTSKTFLSIRIGIMVILIYFIVEYWNISNSTEDVKKKNEVLLGFIYLIYILVFLFYLYKAILVLMTKREPITAENFRLL